MSKLHDTSGEKSGQVLVTTDENGNKTGTATRAECHTGEGKTHLAFMAFIVNGEGKLLLTRRSGIKSLWPLYWDASTISHVLPDETVESAARRRGKEELGMDVAFADLGAFFYKERFNGNSENEYCHILVGVSDEKVEINRVEVDDFRFTSFAGLKREIAEIPGQFTPWLKIALGVRELNEYFK